MQSACALKLCGSFIVPLAASAIESGRNPDLPEFAKALHLAKVTGATLVIAKLDRLSRNAAFLLTLRDRGVRFVAVDLPEANDLTVGIIALVAQQEREAISKRTKEALAVAKVRGARLGNPNGAAALFRAGKGGAPLRAAIARNADRHARDLAPVVDDIRAGGATSLRAMKELNARGMLTRRGGRWHVSTVINLLIRLGLRGSDVRQPAPADMRPMRRFGEVPSPGRRYVERPGVYAVIRIRGEVLVVQWRSQHYLPGGGIDPGEGSAGRPS
jgi:DNA invertase Pin-like site-specific DNA recombinase